LRKYPSLCRILSFILHNILTEIMTDSNYYCVTKGNAEDTTVVPGDSFNFEVKVLYYSQESFPAGVEHRFSPASITSQHFFQEGKSFLQSVMSLSPYTIRCIEGVAEGILNTVQFMFRVYSVPDFLSLESHEESERRVIPLKVKVIILDYEFLRRRRMSLISSPRPVPRRSPRLSARRTPTPSSRVTPSSVPSQRPRSRLSQTPSSGLSQRPSSSVSQRPSSSVSQRQNSEVSQRPSSSVSQRQNSEVNQRPSSSVSQRQKSEVNRSPVDQALISAYLKKCTVMRGRENCCICLEELNTNAECYAMACEHGFHLPCILTWLKTNHACPLCRYSLPTGGKPKGEN